MSIVGIAEPFAIKFAPLRLGWSAPALRATPDRSHTVQPVAFCRHSRLRAIWRRPGSRHASRKRAPRSPETHPTRRPQATLVLPIVLTITCQALGIALASRRRRRRPVAQRTHYRNDKPHRSTYTTSSCREGRCACTHRCSVSTQAIATGSRWTAPGAMTCSVKLPRWVGIRRKLISEPSLCKRSRGRANSWTITVALARPRGSWRRSLSTNCHTEHCPTRTCTSA